MATTLNGVDSTGVGEEAIRQVRALLAWLDDADDSQEAPEEEDLEFQWPVRNRRDAVFAAASLLAAADLAPPTSAHSKNKNKKLNLSFEERVHVDDEELDVFCRFLHENPRLSRRLEIFCIPKQAYRRILEALHDNTSVKELIIFLDGGDEDYGECISNLLQHRDDFQVLGFDGFHQCFASIVPGLRRTHKHLHTLDLSANRMDYIDDEDVRLILQAMKDGDFPALESLFLSDNKVTHVGLKSIAELLPKVAPHLKVLSLKDNAEYDDNFEEVSCLLADEEITKDFALRVLSGDMEFLKELYVDDYKGHSVHIIKALEHCKATLEVLDCGIGSTCEQIVCDDICRQLAESFPKIKSLRRLVCECNYHMSPWFSAGSELELALFQNTSIVEFVTDPIVADGFQGRVAPIFHRNRDVAHVLGLSRRRPLPPPVSNATATTSVAGSGTNDDDENTDALAPPTAPRTAVVPVPRGVWSQILATVGREGSPYGAMPVFNFLRDSNRLASWLSSMTYEEIRKKSKKRKRDERQQGETSTSSSIKIAPQASSTE